MEYFLGGKLLVTTDFRLQGLILCSVVIVSVALRTSRNLLLLNFDFAPLEATQSFEKAWNIDKSYLSWQELIIII